MRTTAVGQHGPAGPIQGQTGSPEVKPRQLTGAMGFEELRETRSQIIGQTGLRDGYTRG